MRLLPTFLLALTTSLASASASEVQFTRIFEGYKPASDFVRISEYFTGRENTRGATIVRTQPTSREGYYFTIRTQATTALEITFVELQIITPTQPEPRTESFAVPLATGSQVLHFGLTGTDWASPKTHPVAWKIRLLSTTGEELASQQSFLWSKPVSVVAASAP
jgi:hypothetical protein